MKRLIKRIRRNFAPRRLREEEARIYESKMVRKGTVMKQVADLVSQQIRDDLEKSFIGKPNLNGDIFPDDILD